MKSKNLWVFVVGVIVAIFQAIAMSMLAVGENCYKESDGNAVNVDLLYTVKKGQLAVVDNFMGITMEAGDSGDTIALDLSPIERQFEVPSSLSVSKGDDVYIEIADVTGHTVDSTAYGTSAGSGKYKLFKATMDKNSDNIVTGIVYKGYLLS